MKLDDVLNSARDSFTVKRVYGEPYEKGGLTVIPAAAVRGGAGGGTGHDERARRVRAAASACPAARLGRMSSKTARSGGSPRWTRIGSS